MKIGLLCGREYSFPPAFIERVNQLGYPHGITAEMVKFGGTQMDEPSGYRVIVDRISHEVPYYRSYLKHAVLEGVTVVNNPFMWTADDKFFEASLATKLGVAHPKTIALPNKDYVPGIKHDESLRNLVFPLDWEEILEYVGLGDKLNAYPDELSGGEQQRVSIARACVNRPLVLLADEPTGNLDPNTSVDIMRLLDKVNRVGTTILMATHDQAIVDAMRKRVIELDKGHVVRDQSRGVYA